MVVEKIEFEHEFTCKSGQSSSVVKVVTILCSSGPKYNGCRLVFADEDKM